MTFSKMVRTQLIVASFGAALMVAGSVKAQEITNTEFSDGPFVVAFAQQAQSVSAQAIPSPAPVMTESQALQAMAAVSMPAIPDDATVLASSELERWVVAGILFTALAVIAFYCISELSALVALKRANHNLRARTATRMTPRTV